MTPFPISRAEFMARDIIGTEEAITSGNITEEQAIDLSRSNKAQRDWLYGPSDENDADFVDAVIDALEMVQRERDVAAEVASEAKTDTSAIAPRSFGITIDSQQGQGKTTLLLFILQTLAANGLLADEELTFAALNDPMYALNRSRVMNADAEKIEIKIDNAAFADLQSDIATSLSGDALVTGNGVGWYDEFTADEIATYGWREALATAVLEATDDLIPADTDEVTITVRKRG